MLLVQCNLTPMLYETNLYTLADLKAGEEGIIGELAAQGTLRQRLLDMGLTKGCRLRVIRYAPLGDPLEIALRGYTLTLRKAEAVLIRLQKP